MVIFVGEENYLGHSVGTSRNWRISNRRFGNTGY